MDNIFIDKEPCNFIQIKEPKKNILKLEDKLRLYFKIKKEYILNVNSINQNNMKINDLNIKLGTPIKTNLPILFHEKTNEFILTIIDLNKNPLYEYKIKFHGEINILSEIESLYDKLYNNDKKSEYNLLFKKLVVLNDLKNKIDKDITNFDNNSIIYKLYFQNIFKNINQNLQLNLASDLKPDSQIYLEFKLLRDLLHQGNNLFYVLNEGQDKLDDDLLDIKNIYLLKNINYTTNTVIGVDLKQPQHTYNFNYDNIVFVDGFNKINYQKFKNNYNIKLEDLSDYTYNDGTRMFSNPFTSEIKEKFIGNKKKFIVNDNSKLYSFFIKNYIQQITPSKKYYSVKDMPLSLPKNTFTNSDVLNIGFLNSNYTNLGESLYESVSDIQSFENLLKHKEWRKILSNEYINYSKNRLIPIIIDKNKFASISHFKQYIKHYNPLLPTNNKINVFANKFKYENEFGEMNLLDIQSDDINMGIINKDLSNEIKKAYIARIIQNNLFCRILLETNDADLITPDFFYTYNGNYSIMNELVEVRDFIENPDLKLLEQFKDEYRNTILKLYPNYNIDFNLFIEFLSRSKESVKIVYNYYRYSLSNNIQLLIKIDDDIELVGKFVKNKLINTEQEDIDKFEEELTKHSESDLETFIKKCKKVDVEIRIESGFEYVFIDNTKIAKYQNGKFIIN